MNSLGFASYPPPPQDPPRVKTVKSRNGISGFTTSSTPGPRGLPGRGVDTVSYLDNEDGSVTVSFIMSDGTTQGPFTGTLTSDSLIALNKLTLEGDADETKFLVKDENVQTNTDKELVTSNTLPSGCSASNMTLSGTTNLSSLSATVAGSGVPRLMIQNGSGSDVITVVTNNDGGAASQILLLQGPRTCQHYQPAAWFKQIAPRIWFLQTH